MASFTFTTMSHDSSSVTEWLSRV